MFAEELSVLLPVPGGDTPANRRCRYRPAAFGRNHRAMPPASRLSRRESSHSRRNHKGQSAT